MSKSDTHPKKSWIRRHKWLAALVVLALVTFGLIQAIEYYVNVDRYRTQLVQLLQERTGMAVSIDRLELTLMPQPAVSAYRVSLGEGDLRIECSEVRAAANWNGLSSREVNVTEVTLYGLSASIPRDFAQVRERIDTIREKTGREEKEPSKWRVRMDRIRAPSAHVHFVGIDQSVFQGDIEAGAVLSDAISGKAEGALPFLGKPARLEADVVVAVHKGARPALVPSGWVEVRGLDPREAIEREALPPLVFEARGTFGEVSEDAISMTVAGQAVAAKGATELVKAAAGPFDGMLWVRGGEITVNNLVLRAPHLTVQGDLTRSPDGTYACRIQNARAEGDALAAIYAMVNSETLELVPQPDAAITATELLAGVEPEGHLRLVEGNVEFVGVQPTLADGSRPFGNLQGRVHIEEGVVHIDEVQGEGITLRGTVTPDLQLPGASVNLAGNLTLSPGVTDAFVNSEALNRLSGEVSFARIAGTFEKGKTLPDDLKIDGTIENARAKLVLGGIEEDIAGLSGRFEAEPEAVTVRASWQSALLGPVSADAQIKPQNQRITGVVQANLGNLNLPFPKDEKAKAAMMNVANAYGASKFDLEIALPTAEAKAGAVRITRQGAPELSAVLTLARAEEKTTVASVDAAGELPLPALRELFPDAVRAEGAAAVSASLPMDATDFVAKVDLTQASLGMGEYVDKKPGDPATADVLIAKVNEAWEPQSVTLHYGGEDIVARFEGERIVSDFEIEMASLQNLFAEHLQASGEAKGSFKTNPLDVDVRLADCALALSETLQFNAINGRVAYANETPRLDGLAIRGLNSDFTITMNQSPLGVWQGTVQGEQLDVNAVTQAVEGFTGKNTEAGASQDASERKPPPNLNLDFRVAKLLYRNAQVSDVRATIAGQAGLYDITNIYMAPAGGAVTGSAQVQMAAGPGPSTVNMDLVMQDVDLSFVDNVAFAEPRGLKGATTGTMKMKAPFGGGVNPTNGATGNIEFTSRNGTLGKIGMASKILTVMRTTEIIRLRMPPTKDEGVTFDTCQGKVSLDSGFMTIQEFALKSPTLAMTAQGTIDFPRDVTAMTVDVSLLQMATQVLDIVNLGDVADKIRGQSSYRVAVTGPPANPKVSVQGLTTGEGLTGPVTGTARDAAKTGEQTVVDVLQGSAEILRGILGGGEKEEKKEPAGQPAP